jgi:hypothetical protein
MNRKPSTERTPPSFDTVHPADHDSTEADNPEVHGVSPVDPTSMPREDDHPGGVKNSPEFHDRPSQPIATPTQKARRERI